MLSPWSQWWDVLCLYVLTSTFEEALVRIAHPDCCHLWPFLLVYFQGDLFAATFLIKNGALVNAATLGAQETPLHLVASYISKKHSAAVMSEMAQLTEALLQAGANPNMQDSKGR